MDQFFDKTDFSFEDIASLIANEAEESIHLEFKDAAALDKTDGKRKEISKDVAAFANADGGLLIYGIAEEEHRARSISFIDGNVYTKEWLEQIINATIQRHIPGLIIFPVRKDGKIEQTIYIVKIPKSYSAPHIAKDKRFYKRFNFQSVQMEEYEIRQLYGQKIRSKLVLQRWSMRNITDKDDTEHHKICCEVIVANIGETVESSFKVNVYFNNFNSHIDLSWPSANQHCDYTVLEKERVKITANGITAIYPDEAVTGMRFDINVRKENIEKALGDVKIEMVLFYPHGEDKMQVDLGEMIADFISNN